MNKYNGVEIAIVGMSAQFPGAGNLDSFWDNLREGRESISFFTEEELLAAGVGSDAMRDGAYVRAGASMADRTFFDAAFFGLTPEEAALMDPQMRLFLQNSWRALEDAGYDATGNKEKIGLFAGGTTSLNWLAYSYLANEGKVNGFAASHVRDISFLCTRVSYLLNLQGPSVYVNTACSTSLVAVQMACMSLLLRECSMALAGGVTVNTNPGRGYRYEDGMIFSKDGHCRAFDEASSGTVASEGAGVVVLKRLSDALADGDNIYAVIRGSGLNNDGSQKMAYSAPSVEGQSKAILKALKMSGLPASSIGYVEAHGTGTKLGDPVEVDALTLAFGKSVEKYCALGTVKSNIGHADAAAGIAGLIKAVLAIRHGEIPPSLHFRAPNKQINFKDSPFYVNKELRSWRRGEYPLRAGVSSFGIGGTNVHVILEEAPEREDSSAGRAYQLINLSAKTAAALERAVGDLRDHLVRNPGLNAADLAHTLQTGRAAFPYRKSIVFRDLAEAVELLGRDRGGIAAPVEEKQKPMVVFMFPGQGTQYVDMCRGLYKAEALFRGEVDACLEFIRGLTGKDMSKVLFPEEGKKGDGEINNTEYTQPALFVIEYALAKLLLSWGIVPDRMIGHSIGEYVAACVSGVFSREDALKLILKRGELMQGVSKGAMLSIAIRAEELEKYCRGRADISLAAVNSTEQCVVSGEEAVIEAFRKEMEERGFVCRGLHTSHAFHSHMVDGVLDDFAAAFGQVGIGKQRVPIVSNLSGQYAVDAEMGQAAYWVSHLRHTIRFSEGIGLLLKHRDVVFVEVGPGRALSAMVSSHEGLGAGHSTVSLVRHPKEAVDDLRQLLSGVGKLWQKGVGIAWEKMYEGERRRRLSLPGYSFEKMEFPVEVDAFRLLSDDRETLSGEDMRDWFYVPGWKQAVLPVERPFTVQEGGKGICSLLFLDDEEMAAGLKEKLGQRGERIVCVKSGGVFRKLSEDLYVLDPGNAEDYRKLLEGLAVEGLSPERFIHGWSGQESVYSLLYLVKAMVAMGHVSGKQIVLLTNELQLVTGEEKPAPGGGAATGLLKVIAQEYPGLSTSHIDIMLPGASAADGIVAAREALMERLAAEIRMSGEGKVVSLRNRMRWEEMFDRLRMEPADGAGVAVLREHGVYLITGGLGKLGYCLSAYLLKHYSARLVLLGRTGIPSAAVRSGLPTEAEERLDRLKEIAGQRGEIMYLRCDVAEEADLRKAIGEAEARFGPVNGLIHAAGVLSGRSFAGIGALEAVDFATQFHPKIGGMRALGAVMKGRDLDFRLVIGSISSVLGGLGFGAYASGSALVAHDAAAVKAEGRGEDWLCVDLDALDLSEEGGKPGAIGYREIPAVIRRVLPMKHLSRVVVSKTGLEQRLRDWVRKEGSLGQVNGEAADGHAGQRTAQGMVGEVAEGLEDTLLKLWRQFFGKEKINVEDNFFEIGGDSLKALTMIGRIGKLTGVDIPVNDFFGNPSVRQLHAYLAARQGGMDAGDAGEAGSEGSKGRSIPRAAEAAYYPASPAQRRMYFLHQLDPGSLVYNNPKVLRIRGKLDEDRLIALFTALAERHEALRTSFRMVGGELVQSIGREARPEISWYWARKEDAAGLTDVEDMLDVQDGSGLLEGQDVPGLLDGVDALHAPGVSDMIRQFVRPFDLGKGPLLRVGVIEVSTGEYLLLTDMHHIITDGVSMMVFIRDFVALYTGAELPHRELQYKDYAVWLQSERQQLEVGRQKAFWTEEFKELPAALVLPMDGDRPVVRDHAGDGISFEIGAGELARLRAIGEKEGATLFMTLLGIYAVMLGRLGNQEDIVIGTPAAGRQHSDLEDMIGLFVNMLPVRINAGGQEAFSAFLSALRRKTLACFDNQAYPYESLVDDLKIARNTSHNPLFDVVFVYQNKDDTKLEIPGLDIRVCEEGQGLSKFDLVLSAVETNDAVHCRLNYSTRLFSAERVERFVRYFRNILDVVIAAPETRIAEIGMLSVEERQRLLNEFNMTGVDYPRGATVHGLFEAQALRHPDKVALVCGDKKITYRELNERVDELAVRINAMLSESDQRRVALLFYPSVEQVVAMLGVMKAGCAFVPLSPDVPGERNEYILSDCQAALLLLGQDLYEQRYQLRPLAGGHQTLVIGEVANMNSELRALPVCKAEDSAYIIYTSGTTGMPKGVEVAHRGIVNYTCWRIGHYRLGPDDVTLQLFSYYFDGYGCNIYPALLSGGSLVLVPEEERMNAAAIVEVMAGAGVSNSLMTPGMYDMLLPALGERGGLDRLRFVALGGEKASKALLNRSAELMPGLALANEYGPTEGTIAATQLDGLNSGNNGIIGRPLANVRLLVLGRYGELLPEGVAGELCIAGDGIAKGYINREELTREKFVTHPLAPGEKIYRTGDLARWLPDGRVEYLGRVDNQLKIRGFRIEPGEIERQLTAYEGVAEAAVIGKEVQGEVQLVAYYVVRAGSVGQVVERVVEKGRVVEQERVVGKGQVVERERVVEEGLIDERGLAGEQVVAGVGEVALRRFLSERLPDYMVPARFIAMERLPLTPNGKLDKNALPDPGLFPDEIYTPPADELEWQLAGIWSEVLMLPAEEISVTASFFSMGGHSLRAMMLVNKLSRSLQVAIPLKAIFRHQDIRSLAGYIRAAETIVFTGIPKAAVRANYPLTTAQRRLFFIQLMDQGSLAYNMLQVVRIDGALDRERLRRAFVQLASRHESLRTAFDLVKGEPVQRVLEAVELEIEALGVEGLHGGEGVVGVEGLDGGEHVVDVEGLNAGEHAVDEALRSFVRAFDLKKAPLLRVGLLKVGEEAHLLAVDMHHIINDGISQGNLIRDFIRLYNEEKLPEMRLQYKDYAEWQQGAEQRNKIAAQRAFWLGELSGEMNRLSLPADGPRSGLKTFESRCVAFRLGARETEALRVLAREDGATLFMVLFAAYTVLLGKLGNIEDLVVGTPVAGRPHDELQDMIGMFVNTIPVRSYPRGELAFTAYLSEMRDRVMACFEHQDHPYEELADELKLPRELGRNLLFDAVFALQNFEQEEFVLPGLRIRPYHLAGGTAKFDLVLLAMEREDGLAFEFEYAAELFGAATMERFITYFKNIIQAVIANPLVKLGEIEMLPVDEQLRLSSLLDNQAVTYPEDLTIVDLFRKQVAGRPGNVALVFGDEEMTYGELDEASDRVALALRRAGVGVDQVVGLLADRGMETVVGMLAILKAGGAYLPIDTSYPRERKEYILQHSGAVLILTSRVWKEEGGYGLPTIYMEDCGGGGELLPEAINKPSDLCYIIYTSGTTGQPKGVMVEHRNVVRLFFNDEALFDFRETDVWTMFHSHSFDFSVWEIYGALLFGGKVVIIPAMVAVDTPAYLRILEEEGVTVLNQTPSAFYNLSQEALEQEADLRLRYIIFGGEALSPHKLGAWYRRYPEARLINMFGITETTVHVTFKEIGEQEIRNNISNIGRPIPTLSVYVFDRHGKLAPRGVAGELYVGGAGVSRGYLGNKALTDQRFVMNPYRDGERLYRSGDLARILESGDIEYLGRIDHQVQLRGFRVELGEIEVRLERHPAIRAAIVLARGSDGDKYLVAYYTADESIGAEALRVYLSDKLPGYMVPSYFVHLAEMPLTSNGKVNRAALPEPEMEEGGAGRAPENEGERVIQSMWQEVLEKDSIGVDVDFFLAGGNSLKLIRLFKLLNERYPDAVKVRTLFEHRTISAIAAYLRMGEKTKPEPAKKPKIKIEF